MSQKKTERLLNLLIALLHTERGVSRERLLRDVYGWQPGAVRDQEAVERQFERDKADLRGLGAEIIERPGYEREDSAAPTSLYRIDPRLFRLPELEFTPHEQSLLALAGLACQGALAAAPARAALRRLEAAGALPDSPPSLVQPRVRIADPRYIALADAASRRAEVTFHYYATSTERQEERRVQPWGLGQRYGQWYLVGYDAGREAPRVFRLSRIRGQISVGREAAFDPAPAGEVHRQLERLETMPRQAARVRIAEGRALELRMSWSALPGAPAPEGWEVGEYSFQDVGVAADYLAGFGDALVVESPTELAEAVVRRLTGALEALGTPGAAPAAAASSGRRTTPADERLGRIVDLVPFLVRGPVPVEVAADRYGISPKALLQELSVLQYSGPTDLGGWQDFIEVQVDDGVVSLANAPELARPRRLSIEEALSLQLGLQALVPMVSDEELPALNALEAKVAAATLRGAGTIPEIDLKAEPQRNAELLPVLRDAAAEGGTLRLEYLNPTKDERTERLVNPLALRSDGDRWYVDTYCHSAQGRRVFRVDRIVSIEKTPRVPLPADFEGSPAAWPFQPGGGDADVVAVLRLAPEALWVEHEYAAEDGIDLSDGSRRVTMRVSGLEWLPRFLAQFGGSVALEGPPAAVAACRAWLSRALDTAHSR